MNGSASLPPPLPHRPRQPNKTPAAVWKIALAFGGARVFCTLAVPGFTDDPSLFQDTAKLAGTFLGELLGVILIGWTASRLVKKRKVLVASIALLMISGTQTCRDLSRAGPKPPRVVERKRDHDAKENAALLRRLEQAAETGDVSAMYDVGVMHYQGAPPDYALARRWWQKAAAAGNANAMYSLGVLYAEGKGVTQDYAQARTWYEQAAVAGNANAMTNLGVQYEYGYGVAQDYAQARQWFQKAADAGSGDARQQLTYLQQRLSLK
jgi:hypothetical protein